MLMENSCTLNRAPGVLTPKTTELVGSSQDSFLLVLDLGWRFTYWGASVSVSIRKIDSPGKLSLSTCCGPGL